MKMHTNELPVMNKTVGDAIRGITWGDMTCTLMQFSAGTDVTPMLKGLPSDMCQVPHWGYVLSGSIHVRYADGSEEAMTPGDAYYLYPVDIRSGSLRTPPMSNLVPRRACMM